MSYLAANFEICSVKITLVIKSQIYNGRRLVSRIRRQGGFPLANLFGLIAAFFLFEQLKVGLLVFQQRKVLLE